jgi:hypothetical protein
LKWRKGWRAMRKSLGWQCCFLVILWALLGATSDSVAGRYEERQFAKLYKQLESFDRDLNFKDLRSAYVKSSAYRPLEVSDYWRADMRRAIREEQWDSAVKIADEILVVVCVDLEAWIAKDYACQRQHDRSSCAHSSWIAKGLIDAVVLSKKGTSKKSAYKLVTFEEWQAVVPLLGLKAVGRSVVHDGAKCFYRVEAVEEATGEKRTVYFDVSEPDRQLDKSIRDMFDE